MSKRHFIVSIKTIDDTPLFPVNFEGENFLFGATAKASAKTRVIFKGYASFPTGLEAVMMDMMTRSMAARGINLDSIPTLSSGQDGKKLS